MPTPQSSASTDESLIAQEQLLLRESVRLLGRGASPDTAIREMLHLLSELVGLNRGRVVLPDADTGELFLYRWRQHAYAAGDVGACIQLA